MIFNISLLILLLPITWVLDFLLDVTKIIKDFSWHTSKNRDQK